MPNEKKITDVTKLANELHSKKIINLDVSVRDLLHGAQGIGIVDPVGPISDNAVAWSDYVLITKGKLPDINQISALKDSIQGKIHGNNK